MGSERKSKRRSSSSSDYSSSDSEDERRSKKHRTSRRDDKERSSSKKEKSSDKKIHKHSDKGKKSEEKHDRKRHKRETHVGHPELSKEDYFSKNKEFSTWLKQEKKIFFSDLSSKESRMLFTDFVKRWNRGKLESQYYEGISTAPRTSHNWKIKTK